MAHAVDIQCLQDKWKICEKEEDQKRSLILDLFKHINTLSHELSEAGQSLEEKNVYIKSMIMNNSEAQKRIEILRAEKENHQFALVVVDGDSVPFKDQLVKEGLAGGKATSAMMKSAVLKELTALGSALPHYLRIVIRVYANLKGLAKTYRDCGVLQTSGVLEEFIRGFNMGDALCDFVDAGNGKECADEKVKAMIQLGVDDVHCRRILFGGSADNGYARMLEKHVVNQNAREKIVLLEGPRFARELADLKDDFGTVSLPDVFRSQKLPNVDCRVPSHPTPPSTPSVGYAAAVAQGSALPGIPCSPGCQKPGTAPIRALAGVFRNKAGERVDAPLRCTRHEMNMMKARKLCNSFHLLGNCPFEERSGSCQHQHGQKLSARELQALCAVARHTPCQLGLSCRDSDCIYGHRCVRDNCTGTGCKFPVELHNVVQSTITRVG